MKKFNSGISLQHLEMFSLFVLLQDLGPLGLKVAQITGKLPSLVHGLAVIAQAALLGRLTITFITGEGDARVLG